MLEWEMIKTFVDTLNLPCFERMIGTQAQLFTNFISIGKCIEAVIKSKKLVDTRGEVTT